MTTDSKGVAPFISWRKKTKNCQDMLSDLGTNVPNYKIITYLG